MNDRHEGLSHYVGAENLETPPLTEAQETDLFRKAKNKDLEARNIIISRNLLYVLLLGRRFSGGKLPLDETTSAANEALVLAVDRFDPERGFRFRSFLVPYVRAAVARCWRARAPMDFKQNTPPIEVSLDALDEHGLEGQNHRSNPVLPTELTTPSNIEQKDHDEFLKKELLACSDTLPERDQKILRMRYVDGLNLAEIGKKLKLSRERVRQIHSGLLLQLRARLERRGIKSIK